ncbi:AAA family ATPase [Methylobacterium aquaticum]|uniref:AAA family ATPase n=1 Tax=Methylobacterium aquaticum TaxID=270351 RepID=UPI001933F734|nr:AAA family ATPase [Methylobacterium aquaticum]QRE76916.1 AAA family ATPase [Methylobacterium aquaticum]
MSNTKHSRRAAANAVARAMAGDTTIPGPREPKSPQGRLEMLAGGEFVGWSAVADATARLMGLPIEWLSERTRRAVEKAIEDPTFKRLRRARAVLFDESARRDLPDMYSKDCAVAHEMLAFNLAALGCSQAHGEITAAALDRFSQLLGAGRHAEAYMCLRSAIVWAGNASLDFTDQPYYSEPNYSQLSQYRFDTRRMLQFATALHDAEAQALIADAILKGGAGQLPPADKDGDLAIDLASHDFMAGTEDLPEPEEPLPIPAPVGRTLVVVGSLAHLPKPAIHARERRDSPRAEFERIENKALPLLPAPDPHAFVEEGVRRAPWLRPIFEILAQDLVGAPYAWTRPTALVSRPGMGKTAAVRAVARGLGLALRIYNAAGAADGSFGGTSRQWISGRASIPLQTLLQEGVANVVIGVDEIEKASLDRRNGALGDTLLPYLERESSKAIFDSYIETNVNLSAVSFLVTANSMEGVPGPLRDRLRILEVPAPGREHLPVVAANLVAEIRAERGLDEAWLPGLDGDELSLLARHWKGGSLRPLRRLVETLLAGRERLAPRH